LINNSQIMQGGINEKVGFNIRRIREGRGLSQEELAALAGLHRAYIGHIERGEKNIGLKNIEKIAKALNIKICVLMDGIVRQNTFDRKKPHRQ
jgi:transcriptional regulator with XRE-family HTH domain